MGQYDAMDGEAFRTDNAVNPPSVIGDQGAVFLDMTGELENDEESSARETRMSSGGSIQYQLEELQAILMLHKP